MNWLETWWNGMSLLQQIFAAAAIPATIVLLIQTVLLLIGLGGAHDMDHGEADHEIGHGPGFDHDHDLDHGHGFDHDHDLDHPHDFGHAHDHGIDHGQSDGHFEPGTHNDVNSVHHHGGAHHASGLRLFTLRGIVALFAVGGWLGVAMCDIGLDPFLSVGIALIGGSAALVFCALIIKWSLGLQENGTVSVRNAIAHVGTVYIPIPPERSGVGKVSITVQERLLELDALTDEKEKIPTGTEVQVISVTSKNELVVRRTV